MVLQFTHGPAVSRSPAKNGFCEVQFPEDVLHPHAAGRDTGQPGTLLLHVTGLPAGRQAQAGAGGAQPHDAHRHGT